MFTLTASNITLQTILYDPIINKTVALLYSISFFIALARKKRVMGPIKRNVQFILIYPVFC